jgi:ATP-dependent DNA helicase RecQ
VIVETSEPPACERRFALVKQAFAAGRAGTGDLMAALRHLLRWEQEHGGQPHRLLPSEPSWPSLHDWVSAGFSDVFEYDEGQLQVGVSPWQPDWLDQVAGTSIEKPLFAEQQRRCVAHVEPDSFLAQVGFDSYKSSGQREAVRAVLSAPPGATLAVVLPTAGGKSLCAHIPALLETGASVGLVLVVVPTVALALDQQDRLRDVIGHPTAYVGGRTEREREINGEIRRRIREGQQRIVFASPESVLQSLASSLYCAADRGLLNLFVVDEAHMVEHWGDEFRSAFQEITSIRKDLLRHCGSRPFRTLLLTATLTEMGLDSLQTLFCEPGPFALVSAAQLRPEPAFWAAYCASDDERASRVIEAVRNLPRPLILYTTLVQDARQWYRIFRDHGYLRTGLMTGQTSRDERVELLARWRADELDIMVATSAFGLGVDKNDVRAVIHACVPENLDRYYQEVGRGGRDGRAAVSLVLYTANDLKFAKNARKLISVELGQERWRAMVRDWQPVGNGFYRVPINVAPVYNPNAQNDYNVAWNLRTLTLMARAGVIALDAEPPPTVAADPDMSEAEIAAMWTDALRDYRNHRIVKPLLDDHQDDAVWVTRIGPLRDESYRSASRSFQLMVSILRGGHHCVADDFRDLYSIPPKGARRGVTVAEACGGCARCRSTGATPYEMEPASPWSPWHECQPLEPVLEVEFAGHRTLAIFHDGFATKQQQRSLTQFVQWMAQQRVRNVVAPVQIGEVLRERLREFSVPMFLFTKYEPLHLQPFATVVVMPDAESVREFRPAIRGGRPAVLLLPRAAADPEAPHRRLRDILSCRTFAFDEFMNRIGL